MSTVQIQNYPFLFFFSYARFEQDKYLERFFDDLSMVVSRKTAHQKPAFRDVREIAPGDDWPTELAEALRVTQTFVCIYSPTYFQREYCGKEFAVFLQRQGLQAGDPGATRIIPVLWLKLADLQRLGLPPATLQAIQYTVSEHRELYVKKGLWGILRTSRRGAYQEILEELADAIVAHLATELPALPERPDLRAAPNVFVTPVTPAGGPGMLRLIHLAPAQPSPEEQVRGESLRHLVQECALQLGMSPVVTLADAGMAATAEALITDLAAAATRNETVLVLARAAALGAEGRAALAQIVAAPSWRGGVLLAGDAGDAGVEALAQQLAVPRDVTSTAPERVLVRSFAGASDELRRSISPLLMLLKRSTVTSGTAHWAVKAEGPSARPMVAGPRGGQP